MQVTDTRSVAGHTQASGINLEFTDLHALQRIITVRLGAERAEARRAARMRELVRLTSDLTRALSTYSRHALVHCQGSAGATDLSADTECVVGTLTAFCQEIREVVAEYEGATELHVDAPSPRLVG